MDRRDFIKKTTFSAFSLPLIGSAKEGKTKPNVLLIFSDQHNANVFSYTGRNDIKTPNFDKFAKQSIIFDRAYCQDGVCCPSRHSMLTGRYCRTLGTLFNTDIPQEIDGIKTMPSLFKENGYKTAAFGKRHLADQWDTGWDYTATSFSLRSEPSDESYWQWIKEQGQEDEFLRDWAAEHGGKYPRAKMTCRTSKLKPENTIEAYTADKTIDFIKRRSKDDKPFFCWCSFYRPHQPYTPVEKFASMYDEDNISLPESLHEPIENLPPGMQKWRNWENHIWCLAKAAKDEKLYRRYISYYYALVTEIDYHVGRVLDALDQCDLADNTIVIYTSDHGDFVGAHGMCEKAALEHNIYEDTLRVPLMIRAPKMKIHGQVNHSLIGLIDLYPTLTQMCGLKKSPKLDGLSIADLVINGGNLKRDMIVSENWSQLTAITKDYKLGIWLKEQKENFGDMLFSRIDDPLEMKNLCGNPEYKEIERVLRKKLISWSQKMPFNKPQKTDIGNLDDIKNTLDKINI